MNHRSPKARGGGDSPQTFSIDNVFLFTNLYPVSGSDLPDVENQL